MPTAGTPSSASSRRGPLSGASSVPGPPSLAVLAAGVLLGMVPAPAETVTAHFASADTIPVTASAYTAAGNEVDLSLGFAPVAGTDLTVVENTGLPFIVGSFSNLAHGQRIGLNFDGVVYRFVASYFGGTGNDLVLQWQRQGLHSWGTNRIGQLGNGTTSTTPATAPVAVDASGALSGKAVLAVDAGRDHALALCSDGTVAGWGSNSSGELGNGSNTNSGAAVAVDHSGALAGKTVVAVSAGGHFSLALCSDGTVHAWGDNGSGQLGNTSEADSNTPVAVDRSGVLSGKTVVAIAAGAGHSLALCSDGTLAAWGGNAYGQLGDGTTTNAGAPVLVNTSGALSGMAVRAIAAGDSHNLVLCDDGTVVAWGYNAYGQLGDGGTTSSAIPVGVDHSGTLSGRSVRSIAAGGSHSLALCSDGLVASWGYNGTGALGTNSTTNSSNPVPVISSGVLAGKTVVSLGAGNAHSFAVCSDGTLASWGKNNLGQLGANTTVSQRLAPVLVDRSGVLEHSVARVIDGGTSHSVALSALPVGSRLSDLSVVGGTLAATFSPVVPAYFATVAPETTLVSVVPVAEDAATIRVNGAVVVSGEASGVIPLVAGMAKFTIEVTGEHGAASEYIVHVTAGTAMQLGFPSPATVPVSAPWVELSGLDVDVTLGFAPPLGTNLRLIENTGSDFIAGEFGNLPRGQVVELPFGGETYRFVANYHGGTGNDLVLEWADRSIASWGWNDSGRLGDGTQISSLLPVAADRLGVLAGKTPVSLTASGGSTLALCADGTLVAWGNNFYGQLGIGTAAMSEVPAFVNDMGALLGRQVVSIASGNTTGLAVCSDGSVATWGNNQFGQLGNGTTTNSNVPVSVLTTGALAGKKVIAAAVGGRHSIALCSDGTLATWGRNDNGQLGRGSWGSVPVTNPVAVLTTGVLAGRKVVAVAAGMEHNLVLCSDGTLAAWGANSYGQLGTGNTNTAYSPVAVTSTGVLAGKTIAAVSASTDNSMVLCSDGTLVMFGRGADGQLGIGTNTDSSLPVAVDASGALAGRTVVTASAGDGCSFAACADGAALAWGRNSYGQLGDGSTTSRSLPVPVDASGGLYGKHVLAVASGGNAGHSHAILAEPASGYIAWMSRHRGRFDRTESADPDADGIPNLMEYVLHGDPTLPSCGMLPEVAAGGDGFVFMFNRLASSLEDTTQVLEYSTNLVNWWQVPIGSESGAEVVLGAVDEAGNQSVTVTVPKDGNPRMFGRLSASRF